MDPQSGAEPGVGGWGEQMKIRGWLEMGHG